MTTEDKAVASSSFSIPSNCRLLFICGDQSGVGKSSIALSILHLLLTRRGYAASELGYIKPCTQCEDVQLIGKYCQQQRIEHVDLGPIIFVSATAPPSIAEHGPVSALILSRRCCC